MKHLFRVQHFGFDKEKEGIWFDADHYSEEEAKDKFEPITKTTLKNNHNVDYTAYRFKDTGEEFYDVKYLGKFEDDDMPHNDKDLLGSILGAFKKK